MKNILVRLLLFVPTALLFGQTIKVKPYLQDATPTSTYINWETTDGTESTVEFGLTNTLGSSASGTYITNSGFNKVHEVLLTGLTPATKYYYRVKTGTAISAIYTFKTPALASAEAPLRFVSMSDMQWDSGNPTIFQQIVNNGVISYFNANYSGDIVDNLDFVLLPGDLVDSGTTYAQWENYFFLPAQNLFPNFALYPILGNHEINVSYYFNYFHLPTNGASGYIEHSYYKDYSNVRIIGLDTNSPYTNQAQLDWLQTTLNDAAANTAIDFVILQMHHPYKSEQWIAGELAYSGQVVTKLEQFSATTGKPSVHIFGHTHAFSRGQSRDAKHLWVNTATSGGNIDYWGEYAQTDYDEFSVSHDEYGFTIFETTADADPTLTIKRISRGDQYTTKNNELSDVVTIKRYGSSVNTPTPVSPIGTSILPECVTLKANTFGSSNTSAQHGQAHWQVSTSETNFTNPTVQVWKNFENWYFNQNTQATDDLTDQKINGLAGNTAYWWRVRYRDKEMNWSDWSVPVSFTTLQSTNSENLLLNPGAENGMSNWTITVGSVEALAANECGSPAPYAGTKLFAVGGICTDTPLGRCYQQVDVSSYASYIDNGQFQANYGAYMRDWESLDMPSVTIQFYNQSNTFISESSTLSTLNTSWTLVDNWVNIPPQTRFIRFEMEGVRNNGSDNDSYIDETYLLVGFQSTDCNQLSTPENDLKAQKLNIIPNPWNKNTEITLQAITTSTKLILTNLLGETILCPTHAEQGKLTLSRGTLTTGIYTFTLWNDNTLIGKGKFIVE